MLNKTLDTNLQALMNLVYPIGSYYITDSTDLDTEAKMNAYFGGEWKQVEGRFLYGADTNHLVGQTGGEETHILTIPEMPSHHHQVAGTGWARFNNGNDTLTNFLYGDYRNTTYNTTDVGGNQPHNNMPPYLVVYIYRRSALSSGGGHKLNLSSLLGGGLC